MNDKKILVIDDDPLFCDLVKKILHMKGFLPFSATSGGEGLRGLYQLQPDLVVLDIMMPGIDGLEVLRRIRQLTEVPVIMLSALSQTEITVRALESGADDYINKPFEKSELLARIDSVLRRTLKSNITARSPHYDDGYLTIDLEENRAWIEGQPVNLTITEYKLLEYLSLNSGHIRTYAQILDNVWGGAVMNSAQNIHVYIWKLRNKIEKDADQPKYLVTEHGVGYRFEKQKV